MLVLITVFRRFWAFLIRYVEATVFLFDQYIEEISFVTRTKKKKISTNLLDYEVSILFITKFRNLYGKEKYYIPKNFVISKKSQNHYLISFARIY